MAFLDAPAKYVSLMGFATFNSVVVTILAIIHIIYITRCDGCHQPAKPILRKQIL
jgi:hypothetical protein